MSNYNDHDHAHITVKDVLELREAVRPHLTPLVAGLPRSGELYQRVLAVDPALPGAEATVTAGFELTPDGIKLLESYTTPALPPRPRLAEASVCDRSRPQHLFVITDEHGNILTDDC